MVNFYLERMLTELPSPYDLGAIRAGVVRWRNAIRDYKNRNESDVCLIERGEAVLQDVGASKVLRAILGNSTYLSECVLTDPAFFCDLVSSDPQETAKMLTEDILGKRNSFTNDTDLMKYLRIMKRRMSLTIGVADICNIWGLDQITWQWSTFADLALSSTVTHLLRIFAKTGDWILKNEAEPEVDSGFFIIGMGFHNFN